MSQTSYNVGKAFDMSEFVEGFKKLVSSLNGKVTAGTLLRIQYAQYKFFGYLLN